jgi:hypothetical protein
VISLAVDLMHAGSRVISKPCLDTVVGIEQFRAISPSPTINERRISFSSENKKAGRDSREQNRAQGDDKDRRRVSREKAMCFLKTKRENPKRC